MSRSLDKKYLLANVKAEDSAAVYKDISRVIATLPENGLLDIELLGKSHSLEPGVNFLQDGNAVAIPKLRLVQAFFVARQIVQRHLASPINPPRSETVEATTVVLLMDPEHLTAANIRKRAVQWSLKSGHAAETTLRREKQFIDSLLTARLHRHTKSPTLWSHRRWLMERFRSSGLCINVREDLVNVMMVSGERHPRNYYAWSHARQLLHGSLLESQVQASIVDNVRDWCFKHHDDISGWSFLGFVILNIQSQDERLSKCSQILTETLNIAESFRWANESVWVFLRTMVAKNFGNEELYQIFSNTAQKLVSDSREDSRAKKTLHEAQQWCSNHRQTT